MLEWLTYEWFVAVLVGLGGGIVNAVLFGGGFTLPRRTSGDEGQTIYDPGFLGAVVISAAAAFLTWAYSTNASFSDQILDVKPIAGALVAGIAGARALAIIVNRQYGEGVSGQTESAAEDLASAVANVTRERDEARAVVDELRRQNRELADQLENSGHSGN